MNWLWKSRWSWGMGLGVPWYPCCCSRNLSWLYIYISSALNHNLEIKVWSKPSGGVSMWYIGHYCIQTWSIQVSNVAGLRLNSVQYYSSVELSFCLNAALQLTFAQILMESAALKWWIQTDSSVKSWRFEPGPVLKLLFVWGTQVW